MRTFSAQQLAAGDYRLCRMIHSYSANRAICRLFRWVSRLGDGAVWYVTVLTLPVLLGDIGFRVAGVLTAAALAGVLIYKGIKTHFKRLRPFHRHDDIRPAAITLDEFSFPSGHTLHAVSFTVILLATLPALGWLFVPFAVLTGISRVILGLHFPSDVLFGALVGGTIALAALRLGHAFGLLPLPPL